MTNVSKVRNAMINVLPTDTANHGASIEPRFMYLPSAHVKALRLSCSLVVGARGVGKSFWTSALASADVRKKLGQDLPELQNMDVEIGFSVQLNPSCYPDSDTFSSFINKGFSAYDIWRAVVARWLSNIVVTPSSPEALFPSRSWQEAASWVKDNPEALAHLMQEANLHFMRSGKQGLILFDALDRTSHDWSAMDNIVRDLLRVVLLLKSFSNLHAKVFLREDQFNRTVMNFPDASKLLSTKVELTWSANDLHGLLWQILCNAEGDDGKQLRELYRQVVGLLESEDAVFRVSDDFKRNVDLQRKLFASLAGEWMGTDRRRGVPYVWTISHLADGKGFTSPRSFLVAIRRAVEDSQEKYPNYNAALHYESIKKGVQKASEIRVQEIAEDYSWVRDVMGPLRGLTLPCEFGQVEEKWQSRFTAGVTSIPVDKLPPQNTDRGWQGIREDLERIGIFKTKKDGRVDMPDLYRVGFGLGRRGGVKPNK
jgi:hypothetical protein